MRPKNGQNLQVSEGADFRVEAIEIPDALKTIIDDQSAITYIGKAHTGCPTDANHWQIKRITVSGSITTIEWADGNTKFDNCFDDRATLIYR